REQVPWQFASEILEFVHPIIPERSLVPEYQKIFSHGYCRGADAFHLATALYLEPEAKNLVFLTADKTQGKIAASLGFRLLS
ncbi:MAG TPA: hypothetical protein DF383_08970, partial [Deltaproteobacteria bacterium]|nr:hypothetical protein [Deltaproteobacteria bacterium]